MTEKDIDDVMGAYFNTYEKRVKLEETYIENKQEWELYEAQEKVIPDKYKGTVDIIAAKVKLNNIELLAQYQKSEAAYKKAKHEEELAKIRVDNIRYKLQLQNAKS